MNDFKVILEAMIDNSSLTNVQKQLAKERLKVSADIDFSNFVSEKQKIQQLANEINKILGDSLKPKEALSWANQYWKQMQSGAIQAQREQEKLNQAQKKSSLATQEKYYKRIIDNNKTIYSLKNKLLSADEKQTKEIEHQIGKLERRNGYNYTELNKRGLTSNDWEREVNASLDVLENQHKINTAKQEDLKISKQISDVDKIQHLSDTGSFVKQVSDATVEYNKLSTVTDDLKSDFAELQRLQTVLGTSQTDEELVNNYEKFNTTLEKVKNNIHVLANEQKQAGTYNSGALAEQKKIDSLAESVLKFRDNNTKMSKELKDKFTGVYDNLINGTNLTEKEVRELSQEFTTLKLKVREAGQLGQSFGDKMKNAFQKFSEWGFATNIVMKGVQAVKDMTQAVIEVDTAMIELTKVSDASSNELKNYFDEAAESAKKLGASISDVISATADFSRLGYNLKDASVLAEVATLYKNVGDGITVDEASSSIVSTMKAFGVEAENAIEIIDKFNEVGNNFAISSGEIGDALKRSASSLAVGGNSLSEAIGLITAGNTVVQDADIVGTALKSMSLRITSTSAELEAMGEDTEFACETLSDYRDLVMGLTDNKVNIVGDDDEYKSTYEILKDISQVWDDMNSMEQSSLMKALFGVRQANIGASILENFDVAEQAMKTAEESAGSALKEQENYEKGIQYSLDRLSASWQEFSNHFLDSSFVKGIVDFGNTTINVIDDITSALGGLGTVGLGAGLFAGIKNIGRPKMFGLVLKYADNYKCSLGY